MGSRIGTELALNALPMALWRRQLKEAVLVHSDHGSQFTDYDWWAFLRDRNLVSRMSRWSNSMTTLWRRASYSFSSVSGFAGRYIQPGMLHEQTINYIEMFYTHQASPQHRRRRLSGRV